EVLDALARTPAAPYASATQFLVGQGHFEAKRYAEATAALEKYLNANPKGDVADAALAYLAQANQELGRSDAAHAAVDRLAREHAESPLLPKTRYNLAESALAARQFDRAAELFGRAAETADLKLKARALSGRGFALLQGKKPAEAAAAFAALLEAAPDDALAP